MISRQGDLLTILERVSYQANRIASIGASEMTDAVLEKSIDLMTAIVRIFTVCLRFLRHGTVGIRSNGNSPYASEYSKSNIHEL